MMTNQEKVARIVELREAGYTWFQVDQMVFPGTTATQSKKKSPSWHFAKKHGAPAFSKQVIGMFTPTQIVIKNPNFRKKVEVQKEETRVTMADLGL